MKGFRLTDFLVMIVLSFCWIILPGQDYDWWSDNVDWDGITPWRAYLISSPGRQGPNALPVPQLTDALVEEGWSFSLQTRYHWMPGDQTTDLQLETYWGVEGGKVGFHLLWVASEWFQTSHEWKTERNVFWHNYYSDQAVGDLRLQSEIQLLQATDHFMDAQLRIGYRFPSGGQQGAARYTDAPGYFFELSGARPITLSDRSQIRLMVMAGFLAWQTNRFDQLQNDAFLAGIGSQFTLDHWVGQIDLRGYSGYLDNGDQPILLSAVIGHRFTHFSLEFQYQHGFADWLYQNLGIRITYSLGQ